MDKNNLIGFLLIALVVLLLQYFNTPPPKEITQTAPNTESSTGTSTPVPSENNVLLSGTAFTALGLDSTAANKKEERYFLENDFLKIEFSNKGAKPVKVELKEFNTSSKKPVMLLDGVDNRFNFQIPVAGQLLNTSDLIFDASQDADALRFTLKRKDGSVIEHTYKLDPGKYVMDMDFRLIGFGNVLPADTRILLDWKTSLISQEHNLDNERNVSTIYYKSGEDVERLSETSSDILEEFEAPLDWVGFKQQFFTSTLIAQNKFTATRLSSETSSNPADSTIKNMEAKLSFNYKSGSSFNFPMQMYLGPLRFQTLQSHNLGLEKQVKLGMGLFRWINQYAILPIFNFLEKYISSYGIIILILTLLVKTLVFPLTRKALVSAAKMQALKPELEEIQKLHQGDAMKIQQETMKIYSASGVSPFGGCLPSLLQLPLFFAMNVFFPAAIELRQEKFLWAKDLSSFDDIIKLPFSIPLLGDHLSIFAILFSITTYLSIKVMANMTPSAAGNNDQMKMIMTIQKIMPFALFFLFNRLPSGLTYYFVISNIITLILQWIIKKFFINEAAIHTEIAANKLKGPKQGGFASRLEEMMKAQQVALEEQKRKSGK